jgi:hypothetical protein
VQKKFAHYDFWLEYILHTWTSCCENHWSSTNTILYPHFGQGTGTKRVSNWYSMRTPSPNLHLPSHYIHFNFSQHTYMCNAQVNLSSFSCVVALHNKFKCTFHFSSLSVQHLCPHHMHADLVCISGVDVQLFTL